MKFTEIQSNANSCSTAILDYVDTQHIDCAIRAFVIIISIHQLINMMNF